MNNLLKAAVAIAAMGLINTAQAATVQIDDFGGGGFGNTPSDFSPTAFAYAGSIGGSRDVSATANIGSGVQVSVTGGQYAHSQTSGATGSSIITWDGAGIPGSGFTAVDLTDGGVNDIVRFVITDTDNNLANNKFELTINGTTILHTFVQAEFLSFATDGFLNVDFLLSDFAGASAATSIGLTINGTFNDAWDVTIDNIGALDTNPVPEPTSISLIGLGLAAMGFNKLRRRKVAA